MRPIFWLLGCVFCEVLLAQPFGISRGLPRHSSGLWSNGELFLDAERLASRPGQLGWAVLHLGPTAALHGLQSTHTFEALPGPRNSSVLLVPIDRPEELDRLAPLAHAETGSCGALEFLPKSYRLADSPQFMPPVYSSLASFDELDEVLQNVSLEKIQASVASYQAVPSRYHNHSIGKTFGSTLAADWQNLGVSSPSATVQTYSHNATPQASVIARLEGLGKADETVILGAHLDSIAVRSGATTASNAPGADDNASGLAILKEILRIVEISGLRFERTIEWQAYAAEEVGLIGSRDIAKAYRDQGRKVAGMLQFDMAAYSASPEAEGLLYFLDDYTSVDVQRQAAEWIRRYIGPYVRYGRIPVGSASDHKAWWEQGYSTLFAFEDPKAYNPFIHSTSDTLDNFDSGLRLRRMTQLGLLFLIHYGGLVDLAPGYEAQRTALLPSAPAPDLHLAIQPAAEPNLSYLSVSAPLSAETLEFCLIPSGTDLACLEDRLRLSKSAALEDRKVFYETSGFALQAAQKWRLYAYDSEGQLVAWRQGELSAPPQ